MYTDHLSPASRHRSNRQVRFTLRETQIEQAESTARQALSSAGERLLTIHELAQEFCVSTKTISRWRRLGLASRPFLLDGRMRVGFLQSSVNRFVANNKERVRRGTEFSQLTSAERMQMIERARCLAQAGGSLTELITRIAHETGRCVETVRYTLLRFDQEHAEVAIFPYRHSPLSAETKGKICRQFHRGESVEALAARFCRSRAGINRILNEVHYAEIIGLPLDYVANKQYAGLLSQKAEAEILGPAPESDVPAKKPRGPSGLPSYLAGLYEVPLLTREQEVHLFRKMNYLKYRASELRAQFDLNQPKRKLIHRIEKLYEESVATKNEIIRANLRLVVSIAKRYVGPIASFFELVSDGNMSLIRAVEKFDFARGNKFSTYASWAIMKNFARTIPNALRLQARFCTSGPEIFNSVEDMRPNHHEQESAQVRRESYMEALLDRLDKRERQIVTSRFGLTRGEEPQTLEQVGTVMGVTKERVRQIQCRAMSKLRKAVKEDRIEDPGKE